MKVPRYLLFLLSCCLLQLGNAQRNIFPRKKIIYDTLRIRKHPFVPNLRPYGLIDMYYVQSLHPIESHDPLFQQYNVVRQLAVNHLIAGLEAHAERYTLNVALHWGTYQQDSYIQEPLTYHFIRVANVEIGLDKNNHWLLDAGITNSPMGLESTTPYRNYALTYSLISSSIPNFRTGVRLRYARSYDSSGTKNFGSAFSILNGWGRIQKVPGNSLPSFALSVGYEKTNDYAFHYNNLLGTDDPDSLRRWRFFQEINAHKHLWKRWMLAFMIGHGFQQIAKNSVHLHHIWGAQIVGNYQLWHELSSSVRAEIFQDPHMIITPNWYGLSPNTYDLIYGSSINVDYTFFNHFKARAEYKYLISRHPVFKQIDNTFLAPLSQFTFSLSCYF